MTSTYVHAYTALLAYSNQMLTKSLTDSIARYAAARATRAKPQVADCRVVVAKCIPPVRSIASKF